ncbi:MAG: hypothetical protein Q8K75_00015 [Chlamydiales bacterium]|nr:hypothetical protein [Chlamydiales bacterium]
MRLFIGSIFLLATLACPGQAEAFSLTPLWKLLGYEKGQEFLHFWNYFETTTATKDDEIANAFVNNWTRYKSIMTVELNEDSLLYELYLNDSYTYSDDYEIYKTKQPKYGYEQYAVGRFMIALALKYPAKMYATTHDFIQTLTTLNPAEPWAEELVHLFQEAQFAIIRNKLDIPLVALETYPEFAAFLVSNNLVEAILAQHHSIAYDHETLMPFMLYNRKWTPWEKIHQDILNLPAEQITSYLYTEEGLISLPGIAHFFGSEEAYKGQYTLQAHSRRGWRGTESSIRLVDANGSATSFGFWDTGTERDILRDNLAYDTLNKYKNESLVTTFAITKQQYKDLLPYLTKTATNIKSNRSTIPLRLGNSNVTLDIYAVWQWQKTHLTSHIQNSLALVKPPGPLQELNTIKKDNSSLILN